jgi:6-phosphofructokinase 1
VVSEGAQDDQGRFLSDQGVTDAFGHAQLGGAAPVIADLVKQELGYKYHWAVADYLQRAARHIASRTDVQHAYAVGKEAVKMALAGDNAVMPAIKRISSKPYKWRIEKAALSKVANVEKKMPRDFITPDGFGITRKCRDYLAPLIKGEDYPPYRNGLPDYVRPKNVQVAKKLKPFEM